jgi:hypothetical protein
MLQPLIEDGRLVRTLPDAHAIREHVLAGLEQVAL